MLAFSEDGDYVGLVERVLKYARDLHFILIYIHTMVLVVCVCSTCRIYVYIKLCSSFNTRLIYIRGPITRTIQTITRLVEEEKCTKGHKTIMVSRFLTFRDAQPNNNICATRTASFTIIYEYIEIYMHGICIYIYNGFNSNYKITLKVEDVWHL